MEHRAVTITQLRKTLASYGITISHKALVAWLLSGRLKGVKIGGRWFVPSAELDRLVQPFRDAAGEGDA